MIDMSDDGTFYTVGELAKYFSLTVRACRESLFIVRRV